MSMNKSFYLGYYFRCENREDVNPFDVFPDESFYRVFDEGGSQEINGHHLYIPNRACEECYHLDKWSDTGIISPLAPFGGSELIKRGGERLTEIYGEAPLQYGVVIYVF